MTIIIKNGTIINAELSFKSDILIGNGKILKLAPTLEINNQLTDKVIDATGKLIFPGGIDTHVHMQLKTAAGYSSDNFFTGSKAAIFGGTTTIIDFVTPHKKQKLCEALLERKREASNSLIDFSFHVSPIEWRNSLPSEIKQCVSQGGITSFKVYMAYKDTIGLQDHDLKRVMKAVAQAGGILTVHCEMGDEIEKLRNNFYVNNYRTPFYHPLSRPPQLEAKAVKKAIEFALETNCKLYIVHVSSLLSLEYIKKAQLNGQNVFAETCPHYLLLNDTKYNGTFEQTAPYVLSPPLRKKEDNSALWKALNDNIIQTVGTDHCPFSMIQKRQGIDDFRKIANGAGSIEHRLNLLYTYGVRQNKINLNQFVEKTSTNAAKIFGLFPQKGIIAEGADADIVIWNTEKENIISSKTHHMNCDIDIFEDFKITGFPEYVIAAGKLAIVNGKWNNPNLSGKFLSRPL